MFLFKVCEVPMMILENESSCPLSCWYTMVTNARLAAGLPTGAPWIKSFNVFTRKLLVFSARTKLIASMRLDLPDYKKLSLDKYKKRQNKYSTKKILTRSDSESHPLHSILILIRYLLIWISGTVHISFS